MIATLARLGWALLVIAALALLLVLRILSTSLLRRSRMANTPVENSPGSLRTSDTVAGAAPRGSDAFLVAVSMVPGLVLLGMFLVSLPARGEARLALSTPAAWTTPP